jgi:hypothetical protein
MADERYQISGAAFRKTGHDMPACRPDRLRLSGCRGMSDIRTGKRRLVAAIWSLTCVALLAIGLASTDFGDLFAEAAAKVRVDAVLATLPGQIVAILLYAAALHALCAGVSYWGALGARLLRDAADNLLIILPGLGELIGTRALVLAGARSRTAVTAIMVDKLAETIAQLPYMALAGVVLFKHWAGAKAGGTWSKAVSTGAAAGLALILALILATVLLARAREGVPGRIGGWIRGEFRMIATEFQEQKRRMPAAIALHFLAWATDAVQVWMAASASGFELGFYAALVMASAAYACRILLAFVPAGLVAQEAGFVAAGLVFGITAPQAIMLSLVLRLRDVLLGVPLLAWPAFEYRHGSKVREGAAH